MKWVLFILFHTTASDGGLAVERETFLRESDCQVAILEIRQQTENWPPFVDAVCVAVPVQ